MSADRNSPPDSPKKPPKAPATSAGGAGETRQERLARALRDNLRKRKAQQRRRQDGGA